MICVYARTRNKVAKKIRGVGWGLGPIKTLKFSPTVVYEVQLSQQKYSQQG